MIKNLIPGLPEHGKIKAGTKGEEVLSSRGKKFRLPKKLNHYIITTTERDNEGNLIVDTDLMDKLKKSGNAIVDKDGNLTGIPIRLLYNDIDLNFSTRYACYVGGRCVCSGDGEVGKTRDGRTVKCPCKQLDHDYKGKDKCKANGRLICVIDGAANVGACHVLRTTSINSIKSIIGGLAFIQAAASGLLAFLPLHLILKPKTITISNGQLSTVYISSIIYRGSIEELRQKSLEMAKEKAQYLIEMDKIEESARNIIDQTLESEQEQKDIQEEFYPDAVDVESLIKTKEEPKLVEEIESKKIEPEAEPEPDKKLEAKMKPEPEPEITKNKPESKKAEEKSDKPDEPEKMIIKDQKKEILRLKKQNKITNPKTWQALLKPFNVKTANNLTFDQANEFIKVLETNPF